MPKPEITRWPRDSNYKPPAKPGRFKLIFVYRVGAAPHFNMVELGKHSHNRTNVWDYPSVNSFVGSRRDDLALHPTVKPTALVADAWKSPMAGMVGNLGSVLCMVPE